MAGLLEEASLQRSCKVPSRVLKRALLIMGLDCNAGGLISRIGFRGKL